MIGSGERTRRAAERPRNGVRLFLYEINFIRAKSMVKNTLIPMPFLDPSKHMF
jgi:hypothetical protein